MQSGDPLLDFERRAHGTHGVVLVCFGDTKHRHHGVADVLFHGATVAGDDFSARGEESVQQVLHLFGI